MRSRTDSFLSKFKRRQESVANFFRNSPPIYDEVVVNVRDGVGGEFSYKATVKRPSVMIGLLPGNEAEPAILPEAPACIPSKGPEVDSGFETCID